MSFGNILAIIITIVLFIFTIKTILDLVKTIKQRRLKKISKKEVVNKDDELQK